MQDLAWEVVREKLESLDVPEEFMNRHEWETPWVWENRRCCKIPKDAIGLNVVLPAWNRSTYLGNGHHKPGLPRYTCDVETFFHESQTIRFTQTMR